MKNMLQTKPWLTFSILLLVVITQSACGTHLGLHGGWVVEEEYEVIEYQSGPLQDRLVFEVSWDSLLDDTNLKTVLYTANGRRITATGPERDGCYFLGTYQEPWGESISTIECLAPFHGLYELEMANVGFFATQARIRIVEEYDTGAELVRQVYSQALDVMPDELVITSHSY